MKKHAIIFILSHALKFHIYIAVQKKFHYIT